MGLSAPSISLTWAYQQRYSANIGLSAPPVSLTWAYQQRYSAKHGLISTAYQPNMGL